MNPFKLILKRFCFNYAFRSEVLLFCSVAADFAFGLYYGLLWGVRGAGIWVCGLFAVYLLLAFVRAGLFWLYEREKRGGTPDRASSYELLTGVGLLVYGGAIIALAVLAYAGGELLSVPLGSVVTNLAVVFVVNGVFVNGYYFFFRFLVPFMGRRHMRRDNVHSAFFRCKKYLTRSESLFVLVVLVARIFMAAGGKFSAVRLTLHLVFFLAVGGYAALNGARLLIRSRRRGKISDEPPIL